MLYASSPFPRAWLCLVILFASPDRQLSGSWIETRFSRFSRRENSVKNLFVGNMSFQTTSADLKALFEPFGQLARVHVAMDRETGRARGFGFVEMINDAEAAAAIAALDGKDMGGRNIKVNEARPKEAGGGGTRGPRSGGGGNSGGYGGGGDRGGNSGPRGKSGGNKGSGGGGKGRFSNEDYSEVARQPREPRW
jgi:RNA recognition motif-containing protein